MPMQPDISFIEIGSSDAAGTGRFLGQLLGWPLQPMGNGGDGWFQAPTMKAGLHGNDPSPGFLVFFGVPDVDMARSKVIRSAARQSLQQTNQASVAFVFAPIPPG
jgi:hypothetical protein